MWTFVYVVFIIVCIFLIVTVLLQPGKGGGLGAAFGGGGNTVFGASGGTPVFRRMTTGAAILFMCLSLFMAWGAVDRSVSSEAGGQDAPKSRGLDFGNSKAPTPSPALGLTDPTPAPTGTEAAPSNAAPALNLPAPNVNLPTPTLNLPEPNLNLQVPSPDIQFPGVIPINNDPAPADAAQ